MSEKIKNYMGIAIIAAVLLFGYAATSFVNTYSKSVEPSTFRSFSVSGESKAIAIPDVATFTFSVITEGGKNVADVQKQNTDKVNKAIAFVKSKGVDPKDIKTENYDVSPRYQNYRCYPYPVPMSAESSGGSSAGGSATSEIYPAPPIQTCPPSQIVGYTVTQTVLVKVRDFGKAGDILSGVVGSGANSVSSLNFTLDDPSKPQNEARGEAIAKAKAKAEDVAKAAGFRLGRLLSIDESGYPVPYYDTYGKGGGSFGAAAQSAPPLPTIEPGSQEVKVTVTLRYEIE